MPEITFEEAMTALNELRSNMVGTQNSSWSNLSYPLVAILNAAGLEQFDPTEDQMRQHLDCYGGAGGYPGHLRSVKDPPWPKPVGALKHLENRLRIYLADPSEKNRKVLEFLVAEKDKV